MQAALSNIEDLSSWYQNNQSWYWTIYKGHDEQKKPSKIIAKNVIHNDFEEGWQLLQDTLLAQKQPSAKFQIFASKAKYPDKGFNTGITTNFIFPKDAIGIAGINGTGIGLFPQMNGYTSIAGMISGQVDQKVKISNLERDKQELEAELDEKNSPGSRIDKIMGMAMDDPKAFAQMAGVFINGISMITNAIKGNVPNPAVNGQQAQGLSQDSIMALNAISDQMDPNEMIQKVCLFIKMNPDKANELFNQQPQTE